MAEVHYHKPSAEDVADRDFCWLITASTMEKPTQISLATGMAARDFWDMLPSIGWIRQADIPVEPFAKVGNGTA